MASAGSAIVALLRAEFGEEAENGFPRLGKVPQTKVVQFLEYFDSLGPVDETIRWVRLDLSDMPQDVVQSNHPLRLKNRHIPKAIAAIAPSAAG